MVDDILVLDISVRSPGFSFQTSPPFHTPGPTILFSLSTSFRSKSSTGAVALVPSLFYAIVPRRHERLFGAFGSPRFFVISSPLLRCPPFPSAFVHLSRQFAPALRFLRPPSPHFSPTPFIPFGSKNSSKLSKYDSSSNSSGAEDVKG